MTDARRNRWVALLLFFAAFVFASAPAHAENVSDLKPTDYINDFAGVLSPPTVHSLGMLCGQVDHRANAQITVITIHTTNGEDIDQFTTELEDKWKVGRKGSDRSVLILLAVDDHHYRIEVGYGLEPILNDAKVGDIGRAMVPALKQADYNTALTQSTAAIAQDIAADANVQLDPQWQIGGQRRNAAQRPLTARQVVSAIVVVVFILWFLTRVGGGGLVGFLIGNLLGGGFGGGRGGGGWGGGGGGFGGGDGGGGGGGDGFGGFGGGSSGGGGASGSW